MAVTLTIHCKGDFYRAELGADNLAGPAYLSATNLAVLNDSPNADILTNGTGGNRFSTTTPTATIHWTLY